MIAAQFPKTVITNISIWLILTGCAGISTAADYLVDSNSNNVDANPGDGVCRDAAGYCTLNAALTEANLDGEPSTITFSMNFSGGFYIPGGSLPTLVEEGTTKDMMRIHLDLSRSDIC